MAVGPFRLTPTGTGPRRAKDAGVARSTPSQEESLYAASSILRSGLSPLPGPRTATDSAITRDPP